MLTCVIFLQTFENIKLIQLEKYHKASTEEERADVELNPKVIFHQAIENCKPILITQNVRRGGVIYQVSGNVELTLKALNYFCINHGEFFSI